MGKQKQSPLIKIEAEVGCRSLWGRLKIVCCVLFRGTFKVTILWDPETLKPEA